MDTKTRHVICCLKRLTSGLGTHKHWKWGNGKDIPCKWKSKERQTSNTYIRQNDFKDCYKKKKNTVTIDKEGHYIIIKGSIQEEDITIVNIYTPNIGAPQCLRQILTDIKGEIDSNIIIMCVC